MPKLPRSDAPRPRAKTDRLDGGKLLTMLMRYLEGERRVWSVVRVPTPQEEDARRAHRELAQLKQERTAHAIGSAAVGLAQPAGRARWRAGLGQWWARHGPALPAALHAGIERELARLVLVKAQIQTLEAQQRTEVATGLQPQVAQLARVRGVGLGGAWVLVKELFGWRRFHKRRQVAGCIGLAPTPYSSGDRQTEQGIAKAGNKRARWIMVELGWSWLRYQPESDLSKWFNQRFAHGGKADAAHRHRGAG